MTKMNQYLHCGLKTSVLVSLKIICNIRSNENIHTCNKDIMIKLADYGTDNSAG